MTQPPSAPPTESPPEDADADGDGLPDGREGRVCNTGFGISPLSWVPALVRGIGCLLRDLFVPKGWGALAELAASVRTKLPFSVIIDVATFPGDVMGAILNGHDQAAGYGGTPDVSECIEFAGTAGMAPAKVLCPGHPGAGGVAAAGPSALFPGPMGVFRQFALMLSLLGAAVGIGHYVNKAIS